MSEQPETPNFEDLQRRINETKFEITADELVIIITLIRSAAERGAVRAEEFTKVGAMNDRLSALFKEAFPEA